MSCTYDFDILRNQIITEKVLLMPAKIGKDRKIIGQAQIGFEARINWISAIRPCIIKVNDL